MGGREYDRLETAIAAAGRPAGRQGHGIVDRSIDSLNHLGIDDCSKAGGSGRTDGYKLRQAN